MQDEQRREEQEKQSRRQFLWKVGVGLAGLMGLSRLTKAMVASQQTRAIAPAAVPFPIAFPIGGICAAPTNPFFHCNAAFVCTGFQCGPSFLGDFECRNDFDCQPGGNFKCLGSEPGNQFECFVSFDCNGPATFWCDPGDFWCDPGPPNQYFCNGVPGAGYTQPPTGCKPLL